METKDMKLTIGHLYPDPLQLHFSLLRQVCRC